MVHVWVILIVRPVPDTLVWVMDACVESYVDKSWPMIYSRINLLPDHGRVYLGTKFSTQVRRTALFQMQLSTSVAVDSLSILPGYCLFFF